VRAEVGKGDLVAELTSDRGDTGLNEVRRVGRSRLCSLVACDREPSTDLDRRESRRIKEERDFGVRRLREQGRWRLKGGLAREGRVQPPKKERNREVKAFME
jgi:hypothetical protein